MLPTLQLILVTAVLLLTHSAKAAGKTNIYIDQIPLYSELAPCAVDRLSAIVRAQFSGCGDDMQLTSFACFCIDSSSEFSSIISTAVQERCAAPQTITGASGTPAALTGTPAAVARRSAIRRQAATTPAATEVAEDVSSALDVWDSYCAKSTELSRFGTPATVTITEAPQTITVAPSSDSQKSGSDTPIAAIVVPVVVVPLVALAGLFLYLRHRRAMHAQNQQQNTHGATPRELDDAGSRGELFSEGPKTQEMQGSSHGYELDPAAHRAELDAGGVIAEKKEDKTAEK